tara:strand:- start:23 stop:130 length:108 start_codon:yes stop_codon:yes gene_type:complete
VTEFSTKTAEKEEEEKMGSEIFSKCGRAQQHKRIF